MLNVAHATNLADQITGEMSATDKMVFNGDPTTADIVAYTHGMIQAIYNGYSLGPSCTPYEIAVGAVTTKMASCPPCTLFMVAQGYPRPLSISVEANPGHLYTNPITRATRPNSMSSR
jgi:hypothetical protein